MSCKNTGFQAGLKKLKYGGRSTDVKVLCFLYKREYTENYNLVIKILQEIVAIRKDLIYTFNS